MRRKNNFERVGFRFSQLFGKDEASVLKERKPVILLIMKITLLSGTNRPGSNTRKVTAHLAELYAAAGQRADLHVTSTAAVSRIAQRRS